MTPFLADLINGAFELVGAVLCWMNIRAYARSRRVAGVYWPTTAFFAAWGYWNVLYYPVLGQWFSFAGGVLLALMNTFWVLWVWLDLRAAKRRTRSLDRAEKAVLKRLGVPFEKASKR